MAAVSQKIPNLLGGVSQQPDPVKLPGQVREADNAYLDPTFGCRKRPGTEYIKTIATDLPENARWFPIFRDGTERYAVCMYSNPTFTVRVWNLNDGTERTVTTNSIAADYFNTAVPEDIKHLTVADYTLLTNPAREVTMASDVTADPTDEALVVLDQVSYNTTYNIDFQGEGVPVANEVYKAAGVEVSPGSYEVDDEGACVDVDSQSFIVDQDGKTGLSFRITNQCSAYLDEFSATKYRVDGGTSTVIEDTPNPAWADGTEYGETRLEVYPYLNCTLIWTWYQPTAVSTGFWTTENIVLGTLDGTVNVSESDWTDRIRNSPANEVITGDDGGTVRLENISDKDEKEIEEYVSRYNVNIDFLNGGAGWREGDEVTVTMDGVDYLVRVTKEAIELVYNSIGTASYTTPADTESGSLSVGDVVTGLSTAINGISGVTAESVGYVIKVASTTDKDFNIGTRGGSTNKAMDALKGTASDVARLPSQGFDNFILKVSNSSESTSDDYYVKFKTSAPGIPGAGIWEETVAPGLRTTLNSSTMPQALTRQADGSFTLAPLNSDSAFGGWAERTVGDDDTNPIPSFVGRGISYMFFHANRFGFLSDDSVIMSQPGDYFNFFSTSALTFADSDPIDITASSTSPAFLKAAIGSPKGLILFAERSQFLLSPPETNFSASSITMTEMSNYIYRSKVDPLNGGTSIAFMSENDSYTKVMEMAVDSVANRPQVAEITKNIPEFLPAEFVWGHNMPNNDMFVFGAGGPEIYVFKFFNNGDTREMAGWARWTYPSDVVMFASEDDAMFVIMDDGRNVTLCKSELVDDPRSAPMDVGFTKFSPRLDVTLTPDQVTTSVASIDTTYVAIASDRFVKGIDYTFMVVDGDFKGTYVKPAIVRNADGSAVLEVSTDLVTGDNYVIGCDYDFKIVLPTIFVKQENIADRTNVPMVSFVHLDLYFSGSYTVTLAKLGYPTKTIEIEQTYANVYDAGSTPATELNQYTIPVFGPGDTINLTVEGSGPYPSSITSYSWDGTYHNRGVQNFK